MTTMTDHLRAARDKMAAAYPVDLFAAASGRVGQWAVLEAPAWASDPDAPVGGDVGAFAATIRLRAVTATPEGVAIMLNAARQALAGTLAVTGRVASLTWERSEFIETDTDVTIPNMNAHPAYGVDTYLLYSQPAA